MGKDNIKMYLGAQQAELNAALMYRRFAELTGDENLKKIFLEAAADEGKHAGILKKYTNKTLTVQRFQADILGVMYRIMPKKIIFSLISKGEYSGGDSYKPYADGNPDFDEMMNDEYRHGDIFKKLSQTK